jgi:hypothetical protein
MARRIQEARESRAEAGVMRRTLGAVAKIGKGNVAKKTPPRNPPLGMRVFECSKGVHHAGRCDHDKNVDV